MITGFKNRFEQPIEDGTKKHTIREDKNDRYKEGKWLHLAVGVRTKAYRLLKKVVCTGTQKIQILYGNGGYFEGFAYQDVRVLIDGRELGYREVSELAKNDGFDMQDSFFKWFNKDFTGKIIHWTELKY
jgi:uncharacterized protein YqfB (UPF0267 family)